MTIQEQFVMCARSAIPGITDAEIARRVGVSRAAISARAFGVVRAVDRWNAGKAPPIRYTPPTVALWGAG